MYYLSTWFPSLTDHLPLFLKTINQNRGVTGWQSHHMLNGLTFRSLYHCYDTKSRNQCIIESHRETIDLQYCYSGSEKISYGDPLTTKKHVNYVSSIDKDIWTASLDEMFSLPLRPNQLVLFEPNQLHCPQQIDGPSTYIEKIVLKIPSLILHSP